MNFLLDIVSWILLLSGGFFCISGGVGVLRFQDFYTRIHAAGVTDTLGAGLILIGLMLQATDWIVVLKLIIVLLFGLLTSPTASHALAKAAMHGKLNPVLHVKREKTL
jgi:multicomponent Na+:H+ antiporter subunit G